MTSARTPTRAAISGGKRQARARRVIARDHGCCYLCGNPGATIADHVTALADGGADHESNMRAACPTCHDTKTRTEIARGRARAQAQRPTQARPKQPHPGLIA